MGEPQNRGNSASLVTSTTDLVADHIYTRLAACWGEKFGKYTLSAWTERIAFFVRYHYGTDIDYLQFINIVELHEPQYKQTELAHKVWLIGVKVGGSLDLLLECKSNTSYGLPYVLMEAVDEQVAAILKKEHSRRSGGSNRPEDPNAWVRDHIQHIGSFFGQ